MVKARHRTGPASGVNNKESTTPWLLSSVTGCYERVVASLSWTTTGKTATTTDTASATETATTGTGTSTLSWPPSSSSGETRPLIRNGRFLALLLVMGMGIARLVQMPSLSHWFLLKEPQAAIACHLNHSSSISSNSHGHDLKQQRPSSSLKTTADRPKGCLEVLHRIHAWNNCWRQYMVSQRGVPYEQRSTDLIPCILLYDTTTSNSSNHKHKKNASEPLLDLIGPPMYTIGYYGGQGFGRVVGHSTEACLVAFLLRRPCLLNLLPRDRYYTWRSFVQSNTLNWDPTILHTDPWIGPSLDALTQMLPEPSDGDWGEAFDQPAYTQAHPWVFPMHEKVDTISWKTMYQASPMNTYNNSHKVLVSPNWGNAWFARIDFRSIFTSRYQCPGELLIAMLQDALYVPTDLLQQLHHIRLDQVINSGMWKKQEDNPSALPIRHAGLEMFPHKDTIYGAIHLRKYFMDNVSEEDVVTKIRLCFLQSFQAMSASESYKDESQSTTTTTTTRQRFPENWWLVADDGEMAVNVAKILNDRQKVQMANLEQYKDNELYNQSFPIVYMYHNSTLGEPGLPSMHSAGELATGLYGHANMAGSLEDWMVLQKSHVAILSPGSAYGSTGAQGNGKIPRDSCGATPSNPHLFALMF